MLTYYPLSYLTTFWESDTEAHKKSCLSETASIIFLNYLLTASAIE